MSPSSNAQVEIITNTVFTRQYLEKSGKTFKRTEYETWRNYALTNVSGIPGPIIGAIMCNTKFFGRKYTMVVGSLLTCAFFFASPNVKTSAQDVICSCIIACFLNIYYGVLYAYTPEVLPSAHRATGNGIAVACNRIMGNVSALVGTFADPDTPAPLYVCGALFIATAVTASFFPFEPYGRRSS